MLAAVGHFLVVVGVLQYQGAVRCVYVSSRRAHDCGDAFDSVIVVIPASAWAVGVGLLLGADGFHG